MRFSTGLVGGALIAGVLSAGSAFASPASISGSATLATPAGFVSTVSGESVLASGFVYQTTTGSSLGSVATSAAQVPLVGIFNPNTTITNAAVIVVPTYAAAGGGTFVTNSVSVGSSAAVTAPTASSSFSVAAAQALNNTTTAVGGGGVNSTFLANTEFINAIIKSGAGVNGLD